MAAASGNRSRLLFAARSRVVHAQPARREANARIDDHFDRLGFQNPILPGETRAGVLFVNPERRHKTSQSRSAADETIDTVLAIPACSGRPQEFRARSRSRSAIPKPRAPTTRTSPRCVRRWSGCHAVQAIRVARGPVILSMPYSWASCPTSARRWFVAAIGATRNPATLSQQVFGRAPDAVLRKSRASGCALDLDTSVARPDSLRGSPRLPRAGRASGGRAFRAPRHGRCVLHEDVDEARNLLVQDLMYSGGLDKLGFATGVGPASPTQPRVTFSGARYYTDGLRAILFFAIRPLSLSDVEFLDWAAP